MQSPSTPKANKALSAPSAQRNRIPPNDGPTQQASRQFLKTLANAGSYGIFVELVRKRLNKHDSHDVNVFGRYDPPFTARVGSPETPGKWSQVQQGSPSSV